MKILKRTKKGFTLVELIVVIAIVAILAAVSVVSYLAFINQANESADIQLVKQLNVALQADQVLNGPRDTMHEMLGAMEDNGFVVENLTKTKSGYDIVWDQNANRFALLDNKENLIYGEDSYKNSEKWQVWKFADTKEEAENKKYSVYLTEEFSKKGVTALEVNAGLDVGNYNKLTSIMYENTSNEQEVVIRTNGGILTIDAASDTVSHYGFATVVNCKDVKVGTYYENGTAGRLIYSDDEGKIYFGSTAVVYCYMNTSSDTNANLSADIQDANATIYTNVQSGGNAVVYENKAVTVTNGLVDVSTCANHNDDYDIIKFGDVTYVVCKCCGGFSRYTVDSEGHLVTEHGDGIDEDNSFGVDNSDLGLDVVEEPNYVAYGENAYEDENGDYQDKYYTSLDEYFDDIRNGDGEFDVYLLCDLEVNLFFELKDVGDTYCAYIHLNNHKLSGNLFLYGTTLSLYDGTVTANIYLNDTTKNGITQNCTLNLGMEEYDDDFENVINYHPVTATGTITLHGEESNLVIYSGSSAQNIQQNDGNVYNYND